MTFGFSKEIVMAVSHSGCETCAKICDDAKKNVKKLEKKIRNKDLSKRERRLLQNRKSALKCRLKK